MGIENNEGKLPYFELDYTKLFDVKGNGLIPAEIVDSETGKNLMLGYMNQEAFSISWRTGEVVFWSRTRQELWYKGSTSGSRLLIQNWIPGCELDVLQVFVKPLGPVCHRGTESCFDQIKTSKTLPNLDDR